MVTLVEYNRRNIHVYLSLTWYYISHWFRYIWMSGSPQHSSMYLKLQYVLSSIQSSVCISLASSLNVRTLKRKSYRLMMFAVDPCVAENRLAAYCGLRATLPLLSPPTCSQPAALLIVHEIAIKLLETRRSLVDGKKRSIAMCNDTQGRLRPKITSEALNVSETSSLMDMTGS